MKNLTDFKKRLIIGSKWLVRSGLKQRIQTVLRIQSNAVIFLREDNCESYLYFPKSSEFSVNDKGEAEIFFKEDKLNNERRKLALTYSEIKD